MPLEIKVPPLGSQGQHRPDGHPGQGNGGQTGVSVQVAATSRGYLLLAVVGLGNHNLLLTGE